MFGWNESEDAYNQVQQSENTSSFGHEAMAGAASFAAMKIYEKRQRENGTIVSHGLAKEMIAGIAGAEIEKLAETKGADAWDRHEAKQRAEQISQHLYDEHYVQNCGANEYNPNQYEAHDSFAGDYSHNW